MNTAGSAAQRLYGCEFEGKFYFPAGPVEAAAFRQDPTRYLANQWFPKDSGLPHRMNPAHIMASGAPLALQGFCPVSLLEVCACVRVCVCVRACVCV